VLFFLFNIFEEQVATTLNPYLPLVVGMYNQFFYVLKTFPYVATFDAWIGATNHYGGIV
jgi:hypothetical protein